MIRIKKTVFGGRCGAALIISMVFLAIFSALAVGMAAMSGTNVQIADNTHNANLALSSAQSGLEILRYYLSGLKIAGTVAPANRLGAVATALQQKLNTAGISNISPVYSASTGTLSIPSVTLNSQYGQTFSAVITNTADNKLQVDITGSGPQFSKKVRANFNFAPMGSTVFDYGVATKGPLDMTGQAEIDGVNLAIEASVYIEADSCTGNAFTISGQAGVAGEVSIANPYGTYSVGDKSSVGGATGSDAHQYIHVGVAYSDFPTPNPDYFRPFATGAVIDSSDDWSEHSVLNNVTISANTNPTFAGNVTINGVLFIETPNRVSFTGKATVNGIIVGDGDLENESLSNSLMFAGQVVCNGVSVLTGPDFEGIKQETGTFIVAPGFSLDFSGQDLNMNGAIAANGITFSGQAGGVVNGSLINYSQKSMLMSGQSALHFNRSGANSNPSGFSPNNVVEFDTSSYNEPAM